MDKLGGRNRSLNNSMSAQPLPWKVWHCTQKPQHHHEVGAQRKSTVSPICKDSGMERRVSQAPGGITDDGAHQILIRTELIHLHRTKWTCASNPAAAGPSCSIVAAGSLPQAKRQRSSYPEGTSSILKSLAGCSGSCANAVALPQVNLVRIGQLLIDVLLNPSA